MQNEIFTNKEIKICRINIIIPIIGYFIFVLTFVCHVQFNLIVLLTWQLYYQQKKKKKKGTYEKFLLLIRIWPCLKPETFRKFRHNLLHSLDAHECLFTTSPSTILPFHTPPPFLSLKLKSEAWLTRRVEEKLRGNTRVDIDSLGFAIVPSRYHPRN